MLSTALVAFLVATGLLLAGEWDVRCPRTRSLGWMDCGGQPDADWRYTSPYDRLPGELLLALSLVGLVAGVWAVAAELRARRRVTDAP